MIWDRRFSLEVVLQRPSMQREESAVLHSATWSIDGFVESLRLDKVFAPTSAWHAHPYVCLPDDACKTTQ